MTKRAIVDIVRAAALGSYGVLGLAPGGPLGALRRRLGLGEPAIDVTLGGRLEVDLRLRLADHLPQPEVARQVDRAVRYALRRALGRDADRLTIHVGWRR
ncbi:MAG TPA: Asp23/Gls24 family envelope stress response protein, partial [Candidatus Limnocylindrales bacterium]|nr:Asp23/Gls24 family envelope stress response protein [Candidatus Limnocylindrales bacterium]